ncbi:hypothetical protein [Maribacter arcticus]|uniref:hypothetical protein n=1 Tax=Maribacter arcticus TaxID=561365 RepID=UPI0030D773DB|tara:strand:+ start:452 stop:1465 length:1014 start_codon:yes stop_codon:yes gene_type:complete
MINKVQIIIFALFFSTFSFSQNSSSVFIQYSSLVQKGESLLLEDNFKKALHYYDDALQTCTPLASDCFTAMQLAAFNNNRKLFKIFMIKGFKAGLTKVDLTKDSLLLSYLNEKKLNDFAEVKYRKNRFKYEKGLNQFIVDTLNKLSIIDNRYKTMYLDSLARGDTLNRNIYEKKYDSIVSNLVEKSLMPLIEKFGFPGQRLTGVSKVGQLNDPYNYSFSNNKALFILLHYYSNPKTCEYNSIFKNEVFKGNMRPEVFASIMDFQFKYGKNAYCKAKPYNQWHKSEDSAEFEIINERRRQIGLGSFQDEEEKYKRGMNICYKYDNKDYKHIRLFYWCG